MTDALIYIMVIPFVGILLVGVLLAVFLRDKNKVPKSGSFCAEVFSKRIGRSYDKRVAQAGISGVCKFEYYVKFRLDGDKVLELQCPCKFYNRISEGDRGILTYDRHCFISFDKSGRNFVYGEQ